MGRRKRKRDREREWRERKIEIKGNLTVRNRKPPVNNYAHGTKKMKAEFLQD